MKIENITYCLDMCYTMRVYEARRELTALTTRLIELEGLLGDWIHYHDSGDGDFNGRSEAFCTVCGTYYRDLGYDKSDEYPFFCTNPDCPAVKARALLAGGKPVIDNGVCGKETAIDERQPKNDECKCKNWAGIWSEDALRLTTLTGHHYGCPDAPSQVEAYEALIDELIAGIEKWASEEDGVYEGVWDSYRRAVYIRTGKHFDTTEPDDPAEVESDENN